VTPRLVSLLSVIGCCSAVSLAQAQPEPAPVAPAPEPPPATEVTPPPAAPPPVADPPPAPTPDPPPAALAPNPPPAGATAPTAFKIEAPNGSSLKLGVLLQPQFQALGDVTRDSMALNMFVRRTRILVGGSLFGSVEYFLDTDYPNLFLANNVAGNPAATPPTADTSVKNTPGMNVQDAFVTYKAVGDAFKIDAGYMLPPLAHNAVQGAGTLYSWDYFTYSFQHSNAFGTTSNPVGRDAGLQLRGLVIDNHLEYRVGLFQGLRDGQTPTEVGANNMFRATGRVQVNILDAETGFFYAGSYLGSKTVLSLGGSFDIQDDYKYFAGDIFADLPVGGNVITAQLNVAHWDGGDFLALVKQTAVMAEAGFHISDLHLAPIVRFEKLLVDPDAPADQTRFALGLAYFPSGHNINLKAFYSNLTVDGADHAANQFNLQGQLYVF